MITYTTGSILDAAVDALTNPVNLAGVMGKGLALEFKRKYPAAFIAYQGICEKGYLRMGQVHVFDRGAFFDLQRYIINFPTKRHWSSRSHLADIESGLVALTAAVRHDNIRSIAIPGLGCGLGGLREQDVHPRIEQAFINLPDVQVWIYAPTKLTLK